MAQRLSDVSATANEPAPLQHAITAINGQCSLWNVLRLGSQREDLGRIASKTWSAAYKLQIASASARGSEGESGICQPRERVTCQTTATTGASRLNASTNRNSPRKWWIKPSRARL